MSSLERAVAALLTELGPDLVLTDPDSVQAYRQDRAEDESAGTPIAVVRAGSTEDVQAAVRIAAASGVAVVARGAGSGLSGGASAVEGGIVISLERMREVSIDPALQMAIVQAGALNGEVKAAAAEHGLWYPPDPSSQAFCSIGGNIATNAGGLCCVKYGVTTDYVLGLTVVLADGKAVTLGGPRLKDVAGLPLTKLFVGSEGTLGIVTEAVLRLVPAQHPPTTLVAVFPTVEGAVRAVVDIKQEMRPSMLEFMDRLSINAVEDLMRMELDRTAEAMLIVQSDEPAETAAAQVARMEQLCEAAGATEVYATSDPEESDALIEARRQALPAIERRGALLLEDIGVPLTNLQALITGMREIAQRRGVEIAVVAHAGDGNTHPLIVFDRADAEQHTNAELAFGDVVALAMSLNGTITGEHGVGRLKQPWLEDYLGADVLELNLRIKRALDPQGILNPGVMFAG